MSVGPILPSLLTGGIAVSLKVPGAIGRLMDCSQLSENTQHIAQKREVTGLLMNGIGAAVVDFTLHRLFPKLMAPGRPMLKPLVSMACILPIYLLTEYVSRKWYSVSKALATELQQKSIGSYTSHSSAKALAHPINPFPLPTSVPSKPSHHGMPYGNQGFQ